MKADGQDPKPVRLSEFVYRQLLLAYPKEHREEYGPAMVQLFRDQSRDAWRQSRRRGLASLWLRVLPDLARTAIQEHLAAIKRRLFTTLTGRVFVRVAVAIFLLVTIAGTLVTLVLPEVYASKVRIKVDSNPGDIAPPDPYFIQKEYEVIQSEAILDLVIEELDLNAKWGREYLVGKLKTSESRQMLKGRIELQPVRNTSLFEISVYDTDNKDASAIANAVAEVYQGYCQNRRMRAREEEENGASGPGAQNKQGIASAIPTVEIIGHARPALRPVRPNVPLNIFLGAVVGMLAGLAIGGAVAFLVGKLAHKKAAAS